MVKKIVKKAQKSAEDGARRAIMEELFYDFNRSRSQIYWTNFFRGMFFGVGSVLGGTLLIALIVWVLSWLTDIPGGFGDFIQYIVDTVQNTTP